MKPRSDALKIMRRMHEYIKNEFLDCEVDYIK